jgi:Holliday junction resolvase
MMGGANDERDLVRLLWDHGFAALRAPASGGATQMPRPDILAGSDKLGLQLAIEVKTTRDRTLYIPEESVRQLLAFAQRFGCRPVLAVKFKGKRRPWLFIGPDKLERVSSWGYRLPFKRLVEAGLTIESLAPDQSNRR